MEHPYLTFTVSIELRNAAFQPDPRSQIAHILKHLAKRVRKAGSHYFPPSGRVAKALSFQLRDVNGNHVGSARVS